MEEEQELGMLGDRRERFSTDISRAADLVIGTETTARQEQAGHLQNHHHTPRVLDIEGGHDLRRDHHQGVHGAYDEPILASTFNLGEERFREIILEGEGARTPMHKPVCI